MSSSEPSEPIEPRELENAGTRALKTTIKVLLDNDFKYKGSAHADFLQPKSGTYVAYRNKNIEPYNNWQDTFRNDSQILLIFEPVRHKNEIPQEIKGLGYKPYVLSHEGIRVHSPGDSLAIFEKKIIGTELVEKTREDGTKVKVVDAKAVKGVLTVIVQYDSDFDHQNAKEYYTKVQYGSDEDEDDYVYEHHDQPNEEIIKKLTRASHKFIKSLAKEMTPIVKEIKGTHSGGKTKRKNKRKSVKNKSLKCNSYLIIFKNADPSSGRRLEYKKV